MAAPITEPPYVVGTDESAALAAANAPAQAAAAEITGESGSVAQLTTSQFFPTLIYPELTPLPAERQWRFSSPLYGTPACREYFSPAITMTGFTNDLRMSSNISTSITTYTFDDRPEPRGCSAVGRSASASTRTACVVEGADVRLDQRSAPRVGRAGVGGRAELVELPPQHLTVGERAGYLRA